jgi:thymidine kinase
MVVRIDGDGNVVQDGAQIQVGGNESYVSYCRVHWKKAIGHE